MMSEQAATGLRSPLLIQVFAELREFSVFCVRTTLVFLTLLLACVSGAAAGRAVAPKDPDVVVTGDRKAPQKLRKQASDFVRAVGAAPGTVPAARWIDPVCPRVFGLSEALNARGTERIRTRALQAGARLAARGCKANLAVVFTLDGADMTRRLGGPAQVGGVKAVRWWYLVETRSRDGGRGLDLDVRTASGSSSGEGSAPVNGGGFVTIPQTTASLVSTMVKQEVNTAVIVVDVNAAEGANLDAVLDYSAFVGLARLQPDAGTAGNSILALFGSERDRRSLSDWDLAFLKTLYTLPLDRTARRHRQQLVGGIVKGGKPDEAR
jgi:hypothetical protein